MRPGQNKRMRGRNNRKGPNPLSRTYESNGPDVKIRGTAHHVAEKYLQLARDAHSSGDPVMAESYLQHAEHYFRLIAAAQQAQQQAQQGFMRASTEAEADDGDDDDDFGGVPDRFASPQERMPERMPQPPQPFSQPQVPSAYGVGPQPYPERNGDRPHHERGERGPQDRSQQDRGPRQPYQDRNNQRRRGQDRPEDRIRNPAGTTEAASSPPLNARSTRAIFFAAMKGATVRTVTGSAAPPSVIA